MNELIVVKQLPIIEEQLRQLSQEIDDKVKKAGYLECTEETVKDVKAIRADLNKDFKSLEEKRKAVKNEVMAPYEAFEKIYKECVTEKYNKADVDLKTKVDAVETKLKKDKEAEIVDYFNNVITKDIDFLKYEQMNINVTLSASEKSLKDQVDQFIQKVTTDLDLISTQENKDEVLYEYKQDLNISRAITTVVNRHKVLDVKPVVEPITEIKIEQPIETKKEIAEEIMEVKLTVIATVSKLRALRLYMQQNNIKFE